MQEGGLIQERYRLESPLGRGGMAEVWRAVDERLQRPVAIKFLTSRYADDPEFLVRFLGEAQSVAGISHGNVVRVLDFGRIDEGPYLVMELVDGGSLCDREATLLSIGEAFRLVEQAASGAGAAHERGIVHRDLKPGNILLTSTGQVKLADFGIATLGSVDHLAETGTAIGSPNYISPEAAQALEVSPASDVYSLGVLLYELLVGRRPFENASPTALALAHVEAEPEPPSVHRPDLPEWVDAIVLRCLAKEPTDRYADGNELARALREGERGTPAVLPIAAARSRRRPGRLTVVSVAAATLLGVGGFVLASGDSPRTKATAETERQATSPGGPARPSAEPTESPSPATDTDDETYEASLTTSEEPSPEPSATSDEGEEGTEAEPETASETEEPGYTPGGNTSGETEEEETPTQPEPEEEEPVEEPAPEETAPEEPEEEPEEEEETAPPDSGDEQMDETL